MKANEFVKKFGWDGAKAKVVELGILQELGDLMIGQEVELKRLVDSHELIEKDFESVEIAEYEHMISGCYLDPYWIRIKQAIADVESCQ